MAGHAPEYFPPGRRLAEWLFNLSDVRISLYMLAAAGGVAAVLLAVDSWLLG